ncbi:MULTISPECIES: class I SAM-dependent methyltransferase [Thermodesulfovibrio]|uniref:Methyltransferase n=1 Tax=Thermodesulfovibrio yellowstonii TaxID=28262 RepID=A0A9W6GES6_9BACT|nr:MULTISPECIES: class I SAM-dependent methyltransferase [Thermodesulfovibrio]GLI52619.1 methyltransferase [Thermodesulfovibrio islandicus]
MKIDRDYIHGYTDKETIRLENQANCLNDLLHYDSVFPENSLILEAGCGVGAQTKIVASKNPNSKFISIDISEDSLNKARALIQSLNIDNVEFQVGDIFDLQFPDEYFDHIFICFVLEHLATPIEALKSLKRVLKKGGSITIIEGDHGSAYFYPYSHYAQLAINAQITLQLNIGGNALIGRQLYPLLTESGYKNCKVSPRMVYVDSSKPKFVEGFIKNTFIAMIEGIREKAINSLIIDEDSFDKGVQDLYRTTQADGTFCYTFFKGTGYNI